MALRKLAASDGGEEVPVGSAGVEERADAVAGEETKPGGDACGGLRRVVDSLSGCVNWVWSSASPAGSLGRAELGPRLDVAGGVWIALPQRASPDDSPGATSVCRNEGALSGAAVGRAVRRPAARSLVGVCILRSGAPRGGHLCQYRQPPQRKVSRSPLLCETLR